MPAPPGPEPSNGRSRRQLWLRYAARCSGCETELDRGTAAWWEPWERRVFCLACGDEADQVAQIAGGAGTAGASARREWRRRHERREARVRAAHPRLGGLILALTDDPASTNAWAVGAGGEERLGAMLDTLTCDRSTVLHDRRLPGSRANIDHLVVTPGRVFVIDAKRYQGQVRSRDVGSLFRRDVRLYVGSRDRTKLISGSLRQARVVAEALADIVPTPRVVPVLCFVDSSWPLFASPLVIDDVIVTWPKALRDLIETKRREGDRSLVDAVARLLDHALRPAIGVRQAHALEKKGSPVSSASYGRYWARTSDPQLVELVLSQLS